MPRLSAYPPSELTEEEPNLDFLMVHTRPRHIWLGNNHYIETDDRRAVVGKIYLSPEARQVFRVVDILEAEESVTEYQVEDARDTIVIETLYDLNGRPSIVESKRGYDTEGRTYAPGTEYGGCCGLTVENQTDGMLRFQLESPEALSMGDVAIIPFETVGERDASESRDEFQTSIDRC